MQTCIARTVLLSAVLLLPAAMPAASAPRLIQEWPLSDAGLREVWDLAIEGSGNLLVGHRDGVARFSTTGALLDSWPDIEGIARPAPDGGFYLLDGSALKLRRYDAAGVLITEWNAYLPGEEAGNPLPRPASIAVGDEGDVYLATAHPGRIIRFDPEGEVVHIFETGVRDFIPSEPLDLTFDPHGNLIVFESWGERIRKFTRDGEYLTGWRNAGPDGVGGNPATVSVDRWGNIYAVAYKQGMIHVWGNDGKPLGIMGSETSPDGRWQPMNVALDPEGNLFVAEGDRNRVQEYGPYGPAFAPREESALLLHIGPVVAEEGACDAAPARRENIVTSAGALPQSSNDFFVYLLATPYLYQDGSRGGVTGIQAGIEYHRDHNSGRGLEVHSWRRCSTLDFAADDWPASGSGNTITWDFTVCQEQELVAAGYFYVSAYSPTLMSVIPHPVTGMAKIASCQVVELAAQSGLDPVRLGRAGFGDLLGCNPLEGPCGDATPTRRSTWGRLKSLYGRR